MRQCSLSDNEYFSACIYAMLLHLHMKDLPLLIHYNRYRIQRECFYNQIFFTPKQIKNIITCGDAPGERLFLEVGEVGDVMGLVMLGPVDCL